MMAPFLRQPAHAEKKIQKWDMLIGFLFWGCGWNDAFLNDILWQIWDHIFCLRPKEPDKLLRILPPTPPPARQL